MKRASFFFVLIIICRLSFSQAIRVEPSSWWIGMLKPELQLMVHGKDIAALTPSINYPGVTITSVTRVQNANYLFINLNIDNKKSVAGNFPIQFMKNGKTISSFQFTLFNRKKNSSERIGFTDRDVIYLITPDRFANGDASNDSVAGMKEGVNRSNENGRHGGDIKGIINHLDYIQNMGFTAVWLTPALENNQPDYSYHGYSITDFCKIDPRIGTNQLYQQLSQDASKKNIKLIMDMVFNHCGLEHWWMKDLPTKDWINFMDSTVYTNHRKTVFQDPHVAQADYIQMSDGWFSKTMPDLNQRNPLLATYLIQNTIWWIEYANLSGIRVDTYPYPDVNFMSLWSKRITEEYPNINIVGEEWSENPALVSYWQKGKINKNGYVSYLPGLMDFPVQSALIKALTEDEKYNAGGFFSLYEMIGNDFQYSNPNNLVVFADNHDIERFYTTLHGDEELLKLGITFILTTRGIPQLLYGTEILLSGDRHGTIRSDFPGGWVGDTVNGFTSKGLTEKQIDTREYIRKLLQWRKTTPYLENAKLLHYKPANGMYVYFRYNNKGKVMVILNKNPDAQQLDFSKYSQGIGNSKTGKNIIDNQIISLQSPLPVPSKSAVVIEITN
jgi:glycosidase